MVTTKTPTEPFAVVRRTLEAILAQDHPHATRLADEDPSPETLAWCTANGVRVSSRKGRADHHRPVWPRRTRCKEGNRAFFYDHWGQDDYDIVRQLDADHVPQPGYLREMLRPFADPGVGHVSAPSICAANARDSWAARTRLHTEAGFHGLFQTGYAAAFAPMCIGSHYAGRTRALRAVDGLSIFGCEPQDRHVAGRPRTYDEILQERHVTVKGFGKPVVVAELGYSGSSGHVADGEATVRRAQPDTPQLVGVVCFNQKEVDPWPDGSGLPDGRLAERVTDN